MDDALLVRVLDGLADADEELHAFADGEPLPVAVLVETDAPHELHDEVGTAGLRDPRVVDLRDPGVLHHGERLPLRLEAPEDVAGVHSGLKHLHRDAATNGLGLVRLVHQRHPTLTDQLADAVGTDRLRLFERGAPRRDRILSGALQAVGEAVERAGLDVSEKLLDGASDRGIRVGQAGLALGIAERGQLLEEGPDSPLLGLA